jgi:hypothetical protein
MQLTLTSMGIDADIVRGKTSPRDVKHALQTINGCIKQKRVFIRLIRIHLAGSSVSEQEICQLRMDLGEAKKHIRELNALKGEIKEAYSMSTKTKKTKKKKAK